MLDTNACIQVLNDSSRPLAVRLREHSPGDVFLCSVVEAELIYSVHRSLHAAANMRPLQEFFAPFVSLPFDDRCADQYGLIRRELERDGTPIGPNDLMIAATAIAHNVTLVTHNTREFGHVVGLQIED